MTTRIPVLFPVETINRELDYRLFLAAKFARPHNRIYIGQHDLIARMAAHIKHGLWVGKNIFALFPQTDLARYQMLRDNGFSIVHHEEEGAVFPGHIPGWERLLRLRLDPHVLQPDDYVCTWGDFQRDFYKNQKPVCADNIITTGHPRFDLYKPAYRRYFDSEAQEIRGRFGDFILVNTNLTYANNGLGLGDTFSSRYSYDPTDNKSRLHYVDMWAHAALTLARYVRVINRISIDFPDVNIVIRPHPSEDRQFYRTVFRDIKNVHVLHEGGVAPWLVACKLMIHDGCTTGLEAFLSDTQIINYKAVIDPAHDLFLPNIFGVKVTTEEEVLETVRTMLATASPEPPPAQFDDLALSLLHNFRHDSWESVIDIMDRAESRIDKSQVAFDEGKFRSGEAVYNAKFKAKSLVRPLMPSKNRDFKLYQSHFYGFDPAQVTRKLHTIQEIIGRQVKFTPHGNSLISIEVD